MLHALRVNFKNLSHTTKNTIFHLVKVLADLSTRLKYYKYSKMREVDVIELRVDQTVIFQNGNVNLTDHF